MPLLSFIFHIIKFTLIISLPFIVLIRGALFLHYEKDFSPYISLGISTLVTTGLLLGYFFYFYGLVSSKKNKLLYIRRRFVVFCMLVLSFVFYGVSFNSEKNAASSGISKEYYSLNPIFRLACTTLFIMDKKAIITDASRVPEDYKRMNLPSKKHSLHYKQKDGYIYAVDLRTRDRTTIRNQLLKVYFKILGFRTLRHTGTGDHLHVSMPCRYRKGSL